MRIHCIQHVPFEGPASIAAWAEARGHGVTTSRLDRGEAMPDIGSLDWLLVMGGPMSVHEEERYPWLAAEKTFIRQVIEAGKTIIGVCLGGQLIAAALGAGIRKAPRKEIGWFPVSLTPQARGSVFGDALPERFLAFHWHGDTFDIPQGAARLAETQACANQAFLYQGRVLGLQFHLEATPGSIAELVAHCADDLVPGPFVQTGEAIRAGAEECSQLNERLWRLLDRLPVPA